MRINYVKAVSITAVVGMLAVFVYIALEDPIHGEVWGGSYGANEVEITTTTTATLNGNPMTEETGFVMVRGSTYILQMEISNGDMNDDIDTVVVTLPSAFTINGGTPDVESESGENTDWNAEIVGSMIRFVAVSDFPGVNQTGGGFYYDISSKYDDALDYTQSGQFTLTVAAPESSTIGPMTVKVSDSKTERGGAEYTESYPVLSVGVGDVFQYITVRGADVKVSFREYTPIGGGGAGAPGDAFLSYVLLKETREERTYVVLGEDVEVVVEPLGEVAAIYDLIIEKYVVTEISDGSITADVETRTFTDLNTEEVSSVVDTDRDGLYDFEDTDDDNDGWSDKEEIKHGTDPLDPTSHPEKEKKFPWWIVAVIVIIIVVILAYFFLIKGKPVEEEVIPPSEEEVEEKVEEEAEGLYGEEVEEEAAAPEAEEAEVEAVEEEVYEVPAAEAAAAEVAYEDRELKELEGLSEELDELLEESEQFACPNCGGVISPEDTICPHCGAELEDVYICPACGAEVPPGATKCPSCGAVFE